MRLHWLTAVLLALLAGTPAVSAPGLVLGDSIGVGVSLASGVKRLAHNSVTIGREDILGQIAQVPVGTVAFVSLGTNDAVGSIKGVGPRVDKVLAAVDAAGITAVWIGPACVIQPWNSTVGELDKLLSDKLAGRMAYVSIADAKFCDSSIRGADGVHFTFAGYKRIWSVAVAAAGVEIDVSVDAPAAFKAVHKAAHKIKKHKKKKLRRHR